jgi:hypothetical protein
MAKHSSNARQSATELSWIYPTTGGVKLTADEAAAIINEPTSRISELDDWEIIGVATGDEWDRLVDDGADG